MGGGQLSGDIYFHPYGQKVTIYNLRMYAVNVCEYRYSKLHLHVTFVLAAGRPSSNFRFLRICAWRPPVGLRLCHLSREIPVNKNTVHLVLPTVPNFFGQSGIRMLCPVSRTSQFGTS